MEKSVTLRFYEVRRSDAARPAFADVLRLISQKDMVNRQAYVGVHETLVRLENFVDEGDVVHGQMIRGQSGNRPGRMMPDGSTSLPFNEPIGHGIAFRYRSTDGLLAMQFDSRILSATRLADYLTRHEPRCQFSLTPRLREDAWQRFNELPLRKFEIAIAGHPQVAGLDNENRSVFENIAAMKEAYGAHTVKVEVSMGHAKGRLHQAAKRFASDVLGALERGEMDVRTLKAWMDAGEGHQSDEIDLMGALFDVKRSLEFQENNFQQFYNLRRDLLAASMPAL